MLGKKIINTGGVACTTDTTQILDAQLTQSTALYRFEDNANDTASGTGKFNKGGIFNGSSSKIALPAILPTSSTADSSVSFWFKYSGGQSGTGTLFSSYGGNSAQPGYHLGLEAAYTYGGVSYPDGSLYLTGYSMGTGSGVNGTTSYADGQWHHVVVTYDFSTGVLSCFVDNASSATLSISFTSRPSTIGPFSQSGDIGYQLHGGPHRYAKCSIDQFRIFNKDLSTSERTTLYNETTTTANTLQVLGDTSCVAAYTFEGNANDLDTSTPKNGTATNVTYDYNASDASIVFTNKTTAAPTYNSSGKFGKSAIFNGSTSAFKYPDDFWKKQIFSISCWFKADNVSSTYQTLFSGYSNDGSHKGFVMAIDTNKISYVHGITVHRGSTTLSNSTWYHFVLVLDGSEARGYLNGVLDLTVTGITSVTYQSSGQKFFTGIRPQLPSSNYAYGEYDGEIDQMRFFEKALSLGEINSLYNETTTTAALGTISNPSTVAYYKMADATDETGSYNGTASNVDFNVQGKYGFAGKFNGSSSKIEVSDQVIPNGAISISFWYNPGGSLGTEYVLGQGVATASKGPTVYWSSQSFGALVAKGTSSLAGSATGSTTYSTTDWHNVVFTWDGTSDSNAFKVYVNGALLVQGTSNTSSASIGAYTNFAIGGLNGGTFANGRIDQIRVFNKTISADEVTKLYNEIQCANTITTPESYFNSVLYTGNATARSIDVGFQPDFTWIKDRTTNYSHVLLDSIRGSNSEINSNDTSAVHTETNGLTAFTSTGFNLGNLEYSYNKNNDNYVSWNWKAAASNTTNNDGTRQSTVRASQESGFSIVSLDKPNTNTDTYGHGLSSVPEMIILKRTASTDDWHVYHKDLGNTVRISLNLAAAKVTGTGVWGSTTPTSSLFTLQNQTGGAHIAYCFHSVDGYQRIGSFTGNGSNNGPFIYTGFEPAWVIIKNADTAYRWYMLDNKRNPTNPRGSRLFANDSTAEVTNSNIVDFHTNGFSLLTSDAEANKSGDKILFMAIAANPDTTAPTKANSFNTLLYTGNDSNNRSITGLGFKPDFIWIKRRASGSESHALYDSVRGANKQLSSDSAATEATNSGSYLGMSSFDSDGFNVGNNGGTNRAPNTYVAWSWKALDNDRNLATINTDGTILSIVSANPEAGFSIVKYTGGGVIYGSKIGHGLNSGLELLIQKKTVHTGNSNWYVITTAIDGSVDYLQLNETSAKTDMTGFYSSFNMNTNGFTDWWGAGAEVINYCFHSVAGYSKIGSYQGNNGSGVNKITLDFEPSWLMVKKTTDTLYASWYIFDQSRGDSYLLANTSGIDTPSSTYNPTFLNDGFQWENGDNSGGWNNNGGTYIYMAFK